METVNLPSQYQQYIHLSRYARWIESEGRRETWTETVDRYINYMFDVQCKGKMDDVKQEVRSAILNLEVMPSMRCMMTAGPALEESNIGGFNCSALNIDHPHAFDEVLYILMHGAGVGFSVERQFIAELPSVAEKMRNSNSTIVVEDSKLGWAMGFRELISCLYAGTIPKWDMSKVRPAGAKLKTFGGRASGPGPLDELFRFVVGIFKGSVGRKLNSLECHDICTKVAECVVVGGVRRSACISLSNLSDDRMRHCKSGEWWLTAPHRALANNSVAYTEKPDTGAFMREWTSLYESKSGERGIINRQALKRQVAKYGRRNSNFDFLVNPCVPADTWIMTTDGARQVSELIGKPFNAIVNGRAYACRDGFFKTGDKSVLEVITDRGYRVSATSNHPVLVETSRKIVYGKNQLKSGYQIGTEWKNVGDLKEGDRLVLSKNGGLEWGDAYEEEIGWLVGEVVGDGGHNPEKYETYVRFWGDSAREMAEKAAEIVKRLNHPYQFKGASFNQDNETWQVQTKAITSICDGLLEPGSKKILPALEKKSSSFLRGFVRGFFDADGSPQGNTAKGRSVRLGQADREKLLAVQRILARFGIASTLAEGRREAGFEMLPDGKGGSKEYPVKEMFELIVARSCLDAFAEDVGFSEPEKISRLVEICESRKKTAYEDTFTTRVVKVGVPSVEAVPVYDCVVDDIHCFDANGIVVHNCSEIILRSNSMCNLSEVVVRENDTEESLMRKIRIATIIGTMQATLTNFPYLREIWKKNAVEEALLGVSLTGIFDNKLTSGGDGKKKLAEFLSRLRECAVAWNEEFALRLGINKAAAITTCKPSGTVSALVDSASGIHPRFAKYYIRRVRADKKDPMAQMMVDAGFPYEDDAMKPEYQWVFSFPMKSPDSALVTSDINAIEHLEYWKAYQDNWTEHKPSVTISVKDHEWMDVGAWVWKHFDSVSGVAFLPYSGHIYKQMPFTECTKEEYEAELVKMPKNVDWSLLSKYEKEDKTTSSHELACSGGSCELVGLDGGKK